MANANDRYINIPMWLAKTSGVSGNELIVLALIYGFTQDKNSHCYATREYMTEFINSTRTATVSNIIRRLEERGLVAVGRTKGGGNRYYCLVTPPESARGSAESARGSAESARGSAESAPNNKTDSQIYNKIKKERDSASALMSAPKNTSQRRWKEFWTAYPRKSGKGAAERSFAKIAPDTELFERIMAGLEKAKRCTQWQRDNGAFIPYPATWLNQRRWEDEYDVAANMQNRYGDTPLNPDGEVPFPEIEECPF